MSTGDKFLFLLGFALMMVGVLMYVLIGLWVF